VTDELCVVAFAGGTGLPVLLSGLRERVEHDLTAVVTVTDDGGSSGHLRQKLGIAARGTCGTAWSRSPAGDGSPKSSTTASTRGVELRDHTVGNIVRRAHHLSGGFSEGIEQAARLLRIKGVVLPAATENLTLLVRYVDGSVTPGESAVRDAGKAVARVAVEPRGVAAPTGVLAAIERADIVVLSAGSLYTSTIPALLGGGLVDALAAFRRPVVYAANLMTQPGETLGYPVADRLRAITEHVGPVRGRRARQLGDAARSSGCPLPRRRRRGRPEKQRRIANASGSACTRRRCCPTPSPGKCGTIATGLPRRYARSLVEELFGAERCEAPTRAFSPQDVVADMVAKPCAQQVHLPSHLAKWGGRADPIASTTSRCWSRRQGSRTR
jgi:uncharacterized cofD-like protein